MAPVKVGPLSIVLSPLNVVVVVVLSGVPPGVPAPEVAVDNKESAILVNTEQQLRSWILISCSSLQTQNNSIAHTHPLVHLSPDIVAKEPKSPAQPKIAAKDFQTLEPLETTKNLHAARELQISSNLTPKGVPNLSTLAHKSSPC